MTTGEDRRLVCSTAASIRRYRWPLTGVSAAGEDPSAFARGRVRRTAGTTTRHEDVLARLRNVSRLQRDPCPLVPLAFEARPSTPDLQPYFSPARFEQRYRRCRHTVAMIDAPSQAGARGARRWPIANLFPFELFSRPALTCRSNRDQIRSWKDTVSDDLTAARKIITTLRRAGCSRAMVVV